MDDGRGPAEDAQPGAVHGEWGCPRGDSPDNLVRAGIDVVGTEVECQVWDGAGVSTWHFEIPFDSVPEGFHSGGERFGEEGDYAGHLRLRGRADEAAE